LECRGSVEKGVGEMGKSGFADHGALHCLVIRISYLAPLEPPNPRRAIRCPIAELYPFSGRAEP